MCEKRFELRIITENSLLNFSAEQFNSAKTVAIKATVVLDAAFQELLRAAGVSVRLVYRDTYYAKCDKFYLFDVCSMPKKQSSRVRRASVRVVSTPSGYILAREPSMDEEE